MSDFKIHILGCGSSLPTRRHLPTAQAVELRGKLYLIDCGEGTQRQLRKQGLSFEAITVIFITHHHGDHIFGLPGLLSSLSMLGRKRALQIIGPRGTKALIHNIIDLFLDWIQYEIVVEEFDDRVSQVVFEDKSIAVSSLSLRHRLPCQGYLLREKVSERHIDRASCDFYQVPLAHYPALLRGEDWLNSDGACIPNSRLTRKGKRPRSYAMCTDTIYLPELHRSLVDVDVLYHETTFLHRDRARAQTTYHSTAHEAAMVARDAGVRQLVIGHYSARYSDLRPFLEEAQEVFEHTILADEGFIISIS